MARRKGFLSRLGRAIERALGFGEPEQPPEQPEPPERKKGRSTPPPGVQPRFPLYHPKSDSWTGRGAPTAREWNQLKRIGYNYINDGATWNDRLRHNSRGLFSTGNIAVDLRAIINALESGIVSPGDLLQILRQTHSAAEEYAYQQDARRGKRGWRNRNPGLPDELFYYHWGY
jgi:hypothetical protein